jgi:hypothetical protein
LPNLWLHCPELPAGAAAALAALHFAEPRPEALARLNHTDRLAGLDFCHHAGIALLVRDILPEATARDEAHNVLRVRALEDTYRQLAGLPVEFVALKGITQCSLFGIRAEDRAQSDIDLYCPRVTVGTAREALTAMGYRPIEGLEAFPTDHFPALMRPSPWKWRGDFFDPDMPLAIELHFRFWNPEMERLPAEGVEDFWARRVRQRVAGVELTVLSPPDAVAYAALHLLRHLLRGDTRAFHVYEVASFLHTHADDEAFWRDWRRLHPASLRRLQAVSFLLAEAWFGCRLPDAVGEEAARLPAATRAWFDLFASAPATGRFRPNKDELWLHLSLLHSKRDAWSVARRRLIPANLPPPARATSTASKTSVYAAWLLTRLRYHTLSLGTTLTSGFRWWRRVRGLGK